MPTFIMLTRVEPEALKDAHSLEQLERGAVASFREQCPQVKWISSYAVLGPYDYVDVFEAPSIEIAAKVSTLVRVSGRAHSEVWAATEWSKFKKMIHAMPALAAAETSRALERGRGFHRSVVPALGSRSGRPASC